MDPMMLLVWVAMGAIFYFLLIRPQRKRQQETREMQSSLQVGSKVVTIGGLHGVVDMLDEKIIVIESPDGSKLTFDRHAIRSIDKEESGAQA